MDNKPRHTKFINREDLPPGHWSLRIASPDEPIPESVLLLGEMVEPNEQDKEWADSVLNG